MSTPTATAASRQRVEQIEKAYEYLLSYAAQGVSAEAAEGRDGDARAQLEAMEGAIDGLVDAFQQRAAERASGGTQGAACFGPFLEVLGRDAHATAAALAVVLSQARISSQLVDNFNVSQHVRALLTDLFLLDEAL